MVGQLRLCVLLLITLGGCMLLWKISRKYVGYQVNGREDEPPDPRLVSSSSTDGGSAVLAAVSSSSSSSSALSLVQSAFFLRKQPTPLPRPTNSLQPYPNLCEGSYSFADSSSHSHSSSSSSSSSPSWQKRFMEIQQQILQKPVDKTGSSPKAIVWACDTDYALCGGIGDRLRGLVLAMYLAAVSGRAFFVHQNLPVNLEYAFLPNRIAWNVDPIPEDFCKASNDVSDCHRMDIRNANGTYSSQFEMVFGKWDSSESVKKNPSVMDIDTHFSQPWPEAFLSSLPWHQDVIVIRSNRVTAMYRKRFVEDLLSYISANKNEVPWNEVLADRRVREIHEGLASMVRGGAYGCGLRFLFRLSSGLANATSHATETLMDLLSSRSPSPPFAPFALPVDSTTSANTTVSVHQRVKEEQEGHKPVSHPELNPSALPSLSTYPSSPSLVGRPPIVTLTQALQQSAPSILQLRNGKPPITHLVGVHARLVDDHTGHMFSDTGGNRLPRNSLYHLMECAEALVDLLGWKHDEVLFLLFSDSRAFREDALQHYAGRLVTDVKASISHVDRYAGDSIQKEVHKYQATMSELVVLSMMDALVLTNSGFGETAAALGLVPDEAIARYWKDAHSPTENKKSLQCYLPGKKKHVCTVFAPCWE